MSEVGSITECTLKEKYGTEDQPTCEISPLLDKFKFNSKFHSKFAYINGSHLERLVMTVTPNMSRVVPFLIEDGKENGGSLVVQGSLQGIHSLGVMFFIMNMLTVKKKI